MDNEKADEGGNRHRASYIAPLVLLTLAAVLTIATIVLVRIKATSGFAASAILTTDALLLLLAFVLQPPKKDLTATTEQLPAWSPGDINHSLESLRNYADTSALAAAHWYWEHKRWKAIGSRAIRELVIALAASAALFPMVSRIFTLAVTDAGLWSSLFAGAAGALFGADRAFGISTAWIRYVTTATVIQRLLGDFRINWVRIRSQLPDAPSPQQAEELIQLVRTFMQEVSTAVQKETDTWAAEFQSALAGLEKEGKAQIESLKAQSDAELKKRAEASRPGAIVLTFKNDDAPQKKLTIELRPADGAVVTETIQGARTWSRNALPAGDYSLTVKVPDEKVQVSDIAVVKPGEVARLEIMLPDLSKAAEA